MCTCTNVQSIQIPLSRVRLKFHELQRCHGGLSLIKFEIYKCVKFCTTRATCTNKVVLRRVFVEVHLRDAVHVFRDSILLNSLFTRLDIRLVVQGHN